MSLPRRSPPFTADARGFTGAERALLICFGLAIVLLAARLITAGTEDASRDAQRALATRQGGLGGGQSVRPVLSPGALPRAAEVQVARKAPALPAREVKRGPGFLDVVGGILGGVQSLLDATGKYLAGAGTQFISNVFLGVLERPLSQIHDPAFQSGRNAGDALSVAAGMAETFGGGGMAAGGLAIQVVNLAAEGLTAGGWTPGFIVVTVVDGAAVAAGVGLMTHGMYMVGKGISGHTPEEPEGQGQGKGEDGKPYTEKDKERLIEDTNEQFPLTGRNADEALTGPPGSKPDVAGPGGKGADIKFRDADGNVVLRREVKSIDGNANSFNTDMSKAAKQVEYNGEVYVQAPAGTNGKEWVDYFRNWRQQPGALDKYKNVRVKIVDPNGQVLYEGPLAP